MRLRTKVISASNSAPEGRCQPTGHTPRTPLGLALLAAAPPQRQQSVAWIIVKHPEPGASYSRFLAIQICWSMRTTG